jgi:Spy/CpxP family protein refolding chaperone
MKTRLILAASLLFAPALVPTLAQAQQGPPPPDAPGMHRGQGPGGPNDGHGGGHDSMGMLPPGMWWKNPKIAANLGLTADQQKKMEDIFIQSRTQLIQLHANLEQQQLLLEPLMDANPIDQPKTLAQIGKIADARAELEKADAKMLLSLRSTLTPDQWTKLQAEHRGHDRGPGPGGRPGDGPGGRGGKRGPGGPSNTGSTIGPGTPPEVQQLPQAPLPDLYENWQ